MAGRPSNRGKKQGANPSQPVPQEGARLPGTEAASPRASGSRSQGARAKGDGVSSARPSSAGRTPNPTTRTRTAEARSSVRSTIREAESSSNGATQPSPGSKALGKATGSGKQPGQKSRPSIAPHLEKISQQKAAEIEEETRGQSENPHWFEQRRNRITASNAHKVSRCKFVNGKSSEIPQSYLKSIVGQGSNVSTPAMQWGIKHEPVAIKEYELVNSEDAGRQISVKPCGLFVDPARSWLAASPDGLVLDKATGATIGLVEVKCPYKHRNHTINKACEDRKFCLERDEGHLQLKKNHAYFTQIQCQLAVTGLDKADLVVYTDRETVVVPVKYDGEFWGKAVDKLEEFYTRAVLPTLQEQNPVLASEE